jgi:adenine-specific DNA-methyltransferase
LIKYLGSKRTLLPLITGAIRELGPGVTTVVDLFSGTSRVGHALKKEGYRVLSNDHNRYAHVLATCYVQADREEVAEDAARLIEEFNALPGESGYFTETFCIQSRFFQPHNGARVDAIREAIARKGLAPELEAVLLVSLMEAADRVDSTTGLQMAYLKQWAPRASKDLKLRMPDVLPRALHGKGEAHGLDALEAARLLDADVAYLDPPYNQHSYRANYHVWESLVRWDKPEVYGIARKRVDIRQMPSVFNSRRLFRDALTAVVEAVRARYLVVSFNNEGYIDRTDMETLLARRGTVQTIEQDFPRYIGSRIGIYSPRGKKVGTVSHVRNKEYIYIVTPYPAVVSPPPEHPVEVFLPPELPVGVSPPPEHPVEVFLPPELPVGVSPDAPPGPDLLWPAPDADTVAELAPGCPGMKCRGLAQDGRRPPSRPPWPRDTGWGPRWRLLVPALCSLAAADVVVMRRMNASWLEFPWSARVEWPAKPELLRYRVESRLLTQYPGVWLLRPRARALPVVALVQPWSVAEAPGPGSEIAWISCVVLTEGREAKVERIPCGALLCLVDERAGDPAFLARPLPEGLLERGWWASGEVLALLPGMTAPALPAFSPPPAAPPQATAAGQLSLFG